MSETAFPFAPPPEGPDGDEVAAPQGAGRKPLYLIGGAVAAAALGVAGWLFLSGGGAEDVSAPAPSTKAVTHATGTARPTKTPSINPTPTVLRNNNPFKALYTPPVIKPSVASVAPAPTTPAAPTPVVNVIVPPAPVPVVITPVPSATTPAPTSTRPVPTVTTTRTATPPPAKTYVVSVKAIAKDSSWADIYVNSTVFRVRKGDVIVDRHFTVRFIGYAPKPSYVALIFGSQTEQVYLGGPPVTFQ